MQIRPCHPDKGHVISRLRWAVCVAALLPVGAVHAGRPMNTDDASANKQAVCHVEAWMDKYAGATSTHLAPTCGVVDDLEVAAEFVSNRPSSEIPQGRALGFKWAPEWANWQEWRFGIKSGMGWEKASGDDWRHVSEAYSLLATRQLNDEWTVHINVGRGHDKLKKHHDTPYGVALAWTPDDHWMVFGEITGLNHTSASQFAGVRYWILPETLGLDVTTGRTNATPESKTWGIGLGWYGLRF